MKNKKTKKVIISTLGAITLGSGITIAAVAQSCAPSSGSGTPSFTNEEIIVSRVNQLSSYTQDSTLDTLSQQLLAVINQNLNSQIENSVLITFNFLAISSSNIVVDGNNSSYTVNIDSVNGTTTDHGVISGSLLVVISLEDGALNVNSGVSGFTVTPDTNVSRIVEIFDFFSFYLSTFPPDGSGSEGEIQLQFLTALNNSLSSQVNNRSIERINFAELSDANVSFNSNESFYTVSIPSFGGVATNNSVLVAGTMVAIVDLNDNLLSIAPDGVSGIGVSVDRNVTDIVSIINQFRTYTIEDVLTFPPSVEILNAINSALNAQIVGVTVATLSFPIITINSVSASPAQDFYTATISNVSGTASTGATLSGTMVITVRIINGSFSIATDAAVGIVIDVENPPSSNINEVVTLVNSFNGYNSNSTPTTQLELQLLAGFNFYLNLQIPGVTLANLSFTEITASNVSVSNTGDSYFATVSNLSGLASNGGLVSGTLLAVVELNGLNLRVEPQGVRGPAVALNVLARTVADTVNRFSSFTSSVTLTQPLELQFLTALNNHLNSLVGGVETQVLSTEFTENTDVVFANNQYTVSTNILNGFASNSGEISGTLVVVFDVNDGQLSIDGAGISGLAVGVNSNVRDIVNAFNSPEIRNFNAGVQPGGIAAALIDAVNTFMDGVISGVTMAVWTVEPIVSSSVVLNGLNYTATATFFAGIATNGGAPSGSLIATISASSLTTIIVSGLELPPTGRPPLLVSAANAINEVASYTSQNAYNFSLLASDFFNAVVVRLRELFGSGTSPATISYTAISTDQVWAAEGNLVVATIINLTGVTTNSERFAGETVTITMLDTSNVLTIVNNGVVGIFSA